MVDRKTQRGRSAGKIQGEDREGDETAFSLGTFLVETVFTTSFPSTRTTIPSFT